MSTAFTVEFARKVLCDAESLLAEAQQECIRARRDTFEMRESRIAAVAGTLRKDTGIAWAHDQRAEELNIEAAEKRDRCQRDVDASLGALLVAMEDDHEAVAANIKA